MESITSMIRVTSVIVFFVAVAFIEAAHACSETSANGCPTIVEIDDNAATFTGSWSRSQSILLWYGDDYEVVQGGGTFVTATATFASPADIEVVGDYSIYARWTAHHNRCTNVTYKIYKSVVSPANLIDTVTKDQTVNGGAWQHLGTYDQFSKNSIPRVVVENIGCGGKFVVADGIRIVREESDQYSIVDEAGIEFEAGDQSISLTSTATVVRSITVTPPADGYVIVNASGSFFSFNFGTGTCVITLSPDVTIDSRYTVTGSMGSIEYTPFSSSRGFSVTKGLSATFNLVCVQSAGDVDVDDSNMFAIFSTTRY